MTAAGHTTVHTFGPGNSPPLIMSHFTTSLGCLLAGATTLSVPTSSPVAAAASNGASPALFAGSSSTASALAATLALAAADDLRAEDIRLSRLERDIAAREAAVKEKREASLKTHVGAMHALVARTGRVRQREQYVARRRGLQSPKLRAGHDELSRLRAQTENAETKARESKAEARSLKARLREQSVVRAQRLAELEQLTHSRMLLAGELRATNEKLRCVVVPRDNTVGIR